MIAPMTSAEFDMVKDKKLSELTPREADRAWAYARQLQQSRRTEVSKTEQPK